MRNREREIEEKRLFAIPAEKRDRFVGEEIMTVAAAFASAVFGNGLLAIVSPKVVCIVIRRVVLVEVTIPLVEAAAVRRSGGARLAQAPLADGSGHVTGVVQGLGDRTILIRQRQPPAALAELLDLPAHLGRVATDPPMPGVKARHQYPTGRRTDGGAGVDIGETRPLRREPVEVRRPDLSLSETAQIRIAEIVGHDEEDVGPRRWRGHRGLSCFQGAGQQRGGNSNG